MKSLLQIPRRSRAKFNAAFSDSDYADEKESNRISTRFVPPRREDHPERTASMAAAGFVPGLVDEPSETTEFLASERRHTSRSKDRRRMNQSSGKVPVRKLNFLIVLL